MKKQEKELKPVHPGEILLQESLGISRDRLAPPVAG